MLIWDRKANCAATERNYNMWEEKEEAELDCEVLNQNAEECRYEIRLTETEKAAEAAAEQEAFEADCKADEIAQSEKFIKDVISDINGLLFDKTEEWSPDGVYSFLDWLAEPSHKAALAKLIAES